MYTPATGFSGNDTFTYTVSDGLLSSTATVHVRVGDTAPDASGQTVDTNEDTDANISLTAERCRWRPLTS